ncbi:hypothetical protein [Massilia sp. TWR1-2-2]|uniref:hypothetical protein n=1 Tax=Massilia sp. TWR1-2-2 TaxID=2804584 RepID=UPI003CEC979D
MKRLTLRSSVALACALSVGAGGGNDGNLQLGGAVIGLSKTGLVLINKGNGDKVAVEPVQGGQVGFVFAKLLSNDENFDVDISASPDNAVCSVANGKGATGSFSISTVVVNCITNTHELGGTVSGLDSNGLVLVNGANRIEVKAGATSFSLTKVAEGSPYGVTILTQPVSRTCRIVDGVGTVGKTDIKNIQVICS